ncbi:MAG: hypothetical protein ACOCZQ_02950 [Nanoarchaeota archaeon]
MCCGPKQQNICGCESHSARHFPTKEEKAKKLEEYKEQLEKELEGVKERINELS